MFLILLRVHGLISQLITHMEHFCYNICTSASIPIQRKVLNIKGLKCIMCYKMYLYLYLYLLKPLSL